MTKSYKIKYYLSLIFSWLLNILPMLGFVVVGYLQADVASKASLSLCVVAAAIMLAVNLITKIHMRCLPWILLLGINFCVQEITPLLITMAVTTLLDEMVFVPLTNHFKSKYVINKELDVRKV